MGSARRPSICDMSEDTAQTPEDDRAWADLTDEIMALGERLRHTYEETSDGSGPTEDEIRQALFTLGRAWNQMAGAVGVAIQDQAVRRHLKRAAGSLASAVATTLEELTPRRPAGEAGAPAGSEREEAT